MPPATASSSIAPVHHTQSITSFSRSPIAFTRDDKFLIVASGNEVKVCNASNGEVLHTLEGHTGAVVDIAAHSDFVTQIYTGSLDGSVKLWDVVDGTMLKSVKATGPVKSIAVVAGHPMKIIAAAQTDKHEVTSWSVQVLDLETSKRHMLFECDECRQVAATKDGNYLCAVGGHILYVWDFRKEKGGSLQKLKHRNELSCVAIHPDNSSVATGDSEGEIVMWYNCFGSSGVGVSSSHSNMHWHAHSVRSLVFTPDGSRLASVGEEAVLVVWQLDSGGKMMLPRLGAPINTVLTTANASHFAVGLVDNSVRVINALSMNIEYSVRGLALGFSLGGTIGHLNKLVMEPSHGYVVLNSFGSSLQFYDIVKDQHVMEQEITGIDYVSRSETKFIAPSRVLFAAFSSNGKNLVTVDQRPNGEVTEYAHIRFWHRGSDGHFALKAHAEAPHRGHITALVYHPKDDVVVSVGSDGLWKMWVKHHTEVVSANTAATSATKNKQNWSWTCRCVASYRHSAASDAAFSSDGSLLAVTFGPTVTLWEPEIGAMRAALTHTPATTVRGVAFIPQSSCVVSISGQSLVVWDLRTYAIAWDWAIDAISIQPHQYRNIFVIAAQVEGNFHVMTFSTESPQPRHVFSLGETRIDSAIFLKDKVGHDALESEDDLLRILCRTSGHKLIQLPPAQKETAAKTTLPELTSAFSQMFGASIEDNKRNSNNNNKDMFQAVAANPTGSSDYAILQAPAHTLPPPSAFFSEFMHEVLVKMVGKSPAASGTATNSKNRSEKKKDDDDDDDVDVNVATTTSADNDVDMVEASKEDEGTEDNPVCLSYEKTGFDWVCKIYQQKSTNNNTNANTDTNTTNTTPASARRSSSKRKQ